MKRRMRRMLPPSQPIVNWLDPFFTPDKKLVVLVGDLAMQKMLDLISPARKVAPYMELANADPIPLVICTQPAAYFAFRSATEEAMEYDLTEEEYQQALDSRLVSAGYAMPKTTKQVVEQTLSLVRFFDDIEETANL